MKKNQTMKSYCYAVLGCLLAIAADQYTKFLAITHLKDKPSIPLIKGVFELQYLENRGAAFGIFQNKQLFFLVGGIFICLLIVYLYGKIPHQKKYLLMRFYMVLLTAGTIGNMIDRIRLNYVVDFLYFSLIDFPIFNVADCFVVVACFLFAFSIFFYYSEEDLSCFSLKKRDGKEE